MDTQEDVSLHDDDRALKELDGQILKYAIYNTEKEECILRFDLNGEIRILTNPDIGGDGWSIHFFSGHIYYCDACGNILQE